MSIEQATVYLVELHQEEYGADPFILRVMSDKAQAIEYATTEAASRHAFGVSVLEASVNGGQPESLFWLHCNDYPISEAQAADLESRFASWLDGAAATEMAVVRFLNQWNHYPHYLPATTARKHLVSQFVEGGGK